MVHTTWDGAPAQIAVSLRGWAPASHINLQSTGQEEGPRAQAAWRTRQTDRSRPWCQTSARPRRCTLSSAPPLLQPQLVEHLRDAVAHGLPVLICRSQLVWVELPHSRNIGRLACGPPAAARLELHAQLSHKAHQVVASALQLRLQPRLQLLVQPAAGAAAAAALVLGGACWGRAATAAGAGSGAGACCCRRCGRRQAAARGLRWRQGRTRAWCGQCACLQCRRPK